MKKLLTFILAGCLLLSFSGCAEGGETSTGSPDSTPPIEEFSEGLSYTKKADGNYCVTGVGTCQDAEIIIPSTYQNQPVVEIGENAFALTDTITRVEIPESVTAISPNAFYMCVSLESVVFKNTQGWIVKELDTVVTGTSVLLDDAGQAATYLKDTYRTYYWRKA